jgi:16S rRNA (cytosine1402-N4)-methyltransferase
MVLIGVDADMTAIEAARDLLAPYASRVTLVHARYDEIPAIVIGAGHTYIHGVLFDLGVSSPQLDEADRGFAYAQDAPLDMRMDRTSAGIATAADIVNGYPAAELARVLREYGEERFARRIADAIIRERRHEPITSTQRLSGIVRDAIPAATRRTGGNPAKRTFQALRIEVNDELGTLRRALPAALGLLAVGGRVAVLAYHSLEDRIVKTELVTRAKDQTPRGLPVQLTTPEFRLLTRGAERPGESELAGNPRAASARLRAAERIREAA